MPEAEDAHHQSRGPAALRRARVSVGAANAACRRGRFARTGSDNAEAVAEICRRLDRLPLAIALLWRFTTVVRTAATGARQPASRAALVSGDTAHRGRLSTGCSAVVVLGATWPPRGGARSAPPTARRGITPHPPSRGCAARGVASPFTRATSLRRATYTPRSWRFGKPLATRLARLPRSN